MRAAGFQLFSAFLVAAFVIFGTGSASAKHASIVIDAETGEVLHASHADDHNYPASLTKMMTLYLAFEALEQGRIKLDTRFSVSKHAAAQAPSKLGLHPGETIAVKDIILALVTKSANDAAVVMAEGLAGSETAFAERMTQQARALGMTSTTYRNASGLPNSDQVTTARDVAKLSQALLKRFPQYYKYFSTEDFAYKGVVYHNHNRLMEGFDGMDGIKTGFIRASGFNLAASAVRNHRRLIGVVMGGQSARSRDTHMAELLEDAFAGRKSLSPTVVAAEKAEDLGSRVVSHLNPISRANAATSSDDPEDDAWGIQVGAYTRLASAEKAAFSAVAKLPRRDKSVRALALAPFKSDKHKIYRARVMGFSEQEARDACRLLQKRKTTCALIAP